MVDEKVLFCDKDGPRFLSADNDAMKVRNVVYNHTYLYGDGVFEGIRVYDADGGKSVFKLKEHIDRLYASAAAIRLHMPLSKEELSDKIVELCRLNGPEVNYLRPIASRGIGPMGLSPKNCLSPIVTVTASHIQLYPPESYEIGLEVIIAKTRRVSPESLPPEIKSCNYLNNIRANIEMSDYNEKHHTDVKEVIMLTHDGIIAEGTADNFFMVGFDAHRKDYFVYTPGKQLCLQGITRGVVEEIVNEMKDSGELVNGYKVDGYHETIITPQDLRRKAKEAFFTGTAAEIVPISRILNAPLSEDENNDEIGELVIGDGTPGIFTRTLMAKFKEYIRRPENGTLIYDKYTNEDFVKMREELEDDLKLKPQTVDDPQNSEAERILEGLKSTHHEKWVPKDHKKKLIIK